MGVAELGQTFSGSHCAVPVGNWALSFLHTVHFSRHHHRAACLLWVSIYLSYCFALVYLLCVARFVATGSTSPNLRSTAY